LGLGRGLSPDPEELAVARRFVHTAIAGLVVAGLAGPLLAGTPTPVGAATVAPRALTITAQTASGPCDVEADLYLPARTPAPAILTTHGFGGAKADQAQIANTLAERGYVVLAYSGLGFGGSDCKISLDDRDHDGRAASQLIRFLGGDPAVPAVGADGRRVGVTQVVRDDARSGLRYDPRVGMIGGSYGGQVQFAAAAVEPRLDTIVPLITWNDLSYSLAPNNTSLPRHSVSSREPGVLKHEWVDIFFAAGIARGAEHAVTDPARVVGCPNFVTAACLAKAQMDAAGYPDASSTAFARGASVASYVSRVRIPTFLGQGQADTLFNLQESLATYTALRRQGTPVKLMWQSWGHSTSAPAPGELSWTAPERSVQGRAFLAWFDHHLRGRGPAPALDFSYFRDWVRYDGDAAPAYASAPSYPPGRAASLYLSGTSSLVASRRAVESGSASWVGLPGPAAASYTETSGTPPTGQPLDAPGTFVRYATAPLTSAVDVVGVPTLDVRLSSDQVRITQAAGSSGRLVFHAKLFDVAPDGTVTLAHRLISPVRVPDIREPVRVELPGIVHRFPRGHRVAVVLAATDLAYANRAAVPQRVAVVTGPSSPGVLSLPVVAGAGGLPAAAAPAQAAPAQIAPAQVGAPALPPAVEGLTASAPVPAPPAPPATAGASAPATPTAAENARVAREEALRAAAARRDGGPMEGFRVAGLAALGFMVSYLLAGRVRRQWQRRTAVRAESPPES
jgi:ABC-2 type transport system ATP-binding protein